MSTFVVPVVWEMCGVVYIEAETAEEAFDKVLKDEEDMPLPDGNYVDGSFGPSADTPELVELYTKMYKDDGIIK